MNMKYNLNRINFVPSSTRLNEAFIWDRTPQGTKFWKRQLEYGLTEEGRKYWQEMKDQAKEEGLV